MADYSDSIRIPDNSMSGVGIHKGDVVRIEKDKEFVSGEIVLVRIGNSGLTIKRFISDDTPPFIYLKPENPEYEVIQFTHEMRIIGRVKAVLKSG